MGRLSSIGHLKSSSVHTFVHLAYSFQLLSSPEIVEKHYTAKGTSNRKNIHDISDRAYHGRSGVVVSEVVL